MNRLTTMIIFALLSAPLAIIISDQTELFPHTRENVSGPSCGAGHPDGCGPCFICNFDAPSGAFCQAIPGCRIVPLQQLKSHGDTFQIQLLQ